MALSSSRSDLDTVSDATPRPVHPAPGLLHSSIALDQWRGLALVLVLISHGLYFTGRVNGLGRIGVNLFFFISGILCFRSLSSRENKSAFQLAVAFWRRRLRRLYPALLAYVAIMFVAVIFLQHLPHVPPGSSLRSFLRALPGALTYSINYSPYHPRSLGHLWSLACEMQFYLLVPLIYLLGGRTPRRRLLVYGFVTAIFLAFGFIYPLRVPSYENFRYHFEIAAWPMMLGFSCEFAKARFLRLPLTLVKVVYGCGGVALLFAITVMPFGIGGKRLIIGLGAFLLLPCLFGYLFNLPLPGRPGRLFAWLGERTYSIYLWQQPLTLCDFLPFSFQPWGALASVFIGAASFRFFELPFMSAHLPSPGTRLPSQPVSEPLLDLAGPAMHPPLHNTVIPVLLGALPAEEGELQSFFNPAAIPQEHTLPGPNPNPH